MCYTRKPSTCRHLTSSFSFSFSLYTYRSVHDDFFPELWLVCGELTGVSSPAAVSVADAVMSLGVLDEEEEGGCGAGLTLLLLPPPLLLLLLLLLGAPAPLVLTPVAPDVDPEGTGAVAPPAMVIQDATTPGEKTPEPSTGTSRELREEERG